MSFDLHALNGFRTANFDGADAIANVGKNGTIRQKGSYHGPLGKIFRASATKNANNAVRAELLCSLGNAFGLEGVGRNEKGVATFSKAFMDSLEKLLGSAFKRDDFEIAADGTVSSGKPLTQRRISAIIKQATLAGKGEYDHDTYKAKLDHVKEAIAAFPADNGNVNAAVRHFEKVAKLMTFVKDELPRLIEENDEFNPKEEESEENPKFLLNDLSKGNFCQRPLVSISRASGYMQDKVGELFHIQENILGNGIAHFADLKDPKEQITSYLDRVCKSFVMTSVDLFLDAEKAGKLEQFFDCLSGTWPCIEGKTTGLIEFRLNNLPNVENVPVATHDKDQPLNQCMGREIAAIVKANPNVEGWKDVADQVKKNLIGTIRPIDIAEKQVTTTKDGEELVTYTFKPLLGETGKPVIRAITEADIDALGEAVMDTILYG
ncbi:MAG: hypothetical protein J5985_08890 [Kiritimatiellae bacterium]|nr:hypothetical protein [Kiritimatiellia bacterium]